MRMVDREARNKLAEQIRHFVVGLKDNFEFDDVVFAIKTHDLTIIEIRRQMWHTYDDLRRHKLTDNWALSEYKLAIVKHCILFLKTDYECKRPTKHTDWSLWPFQDQAQLEAALAASAYLMRTT